MTSRERVTRTLEFKEIDRAPRELWRLPGIEMYRRNELDEVLREFPEDVAYPDSTYGIGDRAKGKPYVAGGYTDAWGSEWHVGETGIAGEVKGFPLTNWSALDSYKIPWELLKNADLSRVSRFCENTDKFVKTGTETRPFERIQFLRGTENVLMDLAYGEAPIYKLLEMLHEFSVKEMEMWANTGVDGVTFMDDWGSQNALLISPDMWREYFKPLYRDYCGILRKKGKKVFFHSDGNIAAIYPELIEIGIDAVNSQLFCMDIEDLAEKYAGKITFWGEIDRQYLLPFGTEDEVRAGVKRAADALFKKARTGVIAQCEWGLRDPISNIKAVYSEWNKY
jgi:hypothetical protein